jgi:hypothetical protein
MTSPKKNKEPLGTYAEALRYVENAKECLVKARKEGRFYDDPKYVRMAGNTLWNAVMIALATRYRLKGRPDINKYREVIARENRTRLKQLNAAYTACHLNMGYDGDLRVTNAKDALDLSRELIEWAAPQ